MKTAQIRKNLKKSIRKLYKQYSFCLKTNTNAWLTDNYYCFERDAKQLEKFFSSVRNRSVCSLLSDIYEKCQPIFDNSLFSDEKSQAKILNDEGTSILFFEYAPIILKSIILIRAGEKPEDELLTEKCVRALKAVDETDYEQLCKDFCENEKLLETDSYYSLFPPEVKSVYRKRIFSLSKKDGKSEKQIIEKLLGDQRHIGFRLFKKRENKNTFLVFIEILLAVLFALSISLFLRKPLLFILFLFPVWQILDSFISVSQMKKNPPKQILRLEGDCVPDNAKTLVTVSMLLPNAKNCSQTEKHLTRLYSSNRDKNIYFCLLVDKKEFSSPEKPDDKANINALSRVIEKLNAAYSNRFLLFVRGREYSKTGSVFTGKNRKMGALCSLVKLIRRNENDFETIVGDKSVIEDFKYILALDSDTRLGFMTAHKLIMTALHPLNRAVVDKESRAVKSGYGIFSLRVQNRVLEENDTSFSLLMSGSGGSSAYDELCSERFSDVFDSGIFAGKGLIDVKAYDEVILDRFKDEKILSHDIIEGEFLKTLFVSDAQVQDSFPKSEHSYLSRLHRWIRGDWQNIGFLLPSPSALKGNEKNSLSFISRYKLFENLRRSVTAVFALLLLVSSVFFSNPIREVMISVSLLSVFSGELISFFKALFSGGTAMLSRLYYSAAVPEALSRLTQAAINLIMLPVTAFKSASAVLRALFRQLISKKKLLEWTTAADSEKSNNFFRILINNTPSVLTAAILFYFHSPYTVLCGILFLFNILFEYFSQKPIKRDDGEIDALTKERLLSHAAAQWKYYEDYSSGKDNYLPADNVQFSPVFRVAHRTSPTNIGLMLVCVLMAEKSGFIGEKEMLERIEKSVTSIEKLEKYRGNLYNWYDTLTLSPLEPRFVSTVDSGNLLCSLTALKQGLKGYGKNTKRTRELINRIEKIIDETDLTFLYNKKRHLFHIGFDVTENALSSSYYDLMMSEARMTSYFAVSRRTVDKKHWGALSRLPGKAGRYTGPLSWSGTMFEYFMPNIFLPAKKNTFSYEGLRFCLYCQSLYAKKKKIPWGVSESAFYSFDSDYNYQYKAHGINRLRLSRANENDVVISPYSSYLALPFSPKKASANIKRLERLHLLGPYGLYEAADFTRDRTENREYRIIKSYMAHHIGMSMLSVFNATDSFAVQKLFMSDLDMAAGNALLDEQIPTYTPILKNISKRTKKQKDERRERFVKERNSFSVLNPKAQAYSNGEWTLTVCENGVTKSTYRDKCIFRHSEDMLFSPNSVTAIFRANGVKKHFSPFMNLDEKEKYSCVFKENEAQITYLDSDVKLTQRLSVHRFLPLEKRSFTLQNLSKRRLDGELIIYLEPCLTDFQTQKSHPAFSNLFVTDSFDEKEKILSFSRRDKNFDNQMALSCGFLKDTPFSFTCKRENVLKRPYGIFSLENFDNNFSAQSGIPDCCGLFSVRVSLSPKEKKTFTLFFAAEKDSKKSEEIIVSGRRNGSLSSFENANAVLGSSSQTSVLAREILPNLIFTPVLKEKTVNAISKNERAVDALWSMGISGDRPIILFPFESTGDLTFLSRLLKIHTCFINSFIKNDLVILCDSQRKNEIKRFLKEEGKSRGDIFIIEKDKYDESAVNFLYACCSFLAENKIEEKKQENRFSKIKILCGKRKESENSLLKDGYEINVSPVLPWCFIYSDDCFGTLLTDKGPGFSYYSNSFLNKLTPWSNDTRTDLNGEMLLIKTENGYYNPLLQSNVTFLKDKAVYKSICDNIEFTVEINVENGEKHILLKALNLTDKKRSIKAIYSAEPVLSFEKGKERLLKIENTDEKITFSNPLNTDFNGKMTLSTPDADILIFDKLSLFGGEWKKHSNKISAYPVAALGKEILLEKEAEISFTLGYEGGEKSTISKLKNEIEIHSPDKNLDALVNTFLPIQIIRGRLQARTGFYQCSGAYGFRDQIQDTLSLCVLSPERLRRQIFINASAQFTEGDCMHWFHVLPDGKIKGVRTRYSDDRLWLVKAVCEYVKATGDSKILYENAPFLKCEQLKENETERYIETYPSEEYGAIFDHCVRAIEKSLVFGKNGLPLILGGDWNDGYNTVGRKGNGESVWLGEFLITVLEDFCALCDEKRKEKYSSLAASLRQAIDKNAYSDERYVRAFLDDGSALGNEDSEECKIDSLSQSFAVFCKMPDKKRVTAALENAESQLVDREHGLIKLFSEGFENDRRAGYISAYPVGLRENGGQYTHAAVWLCKAFIENGQADKGYELLSLLNPLNKYENVSDAKMYMTEPYFLAGDVYSAKGVCGRGGWSIYSGSAGWYYKTVIEDIFGIKKEGKKIFIKPSFPSEWDKCVLTLTLEEEKYEIEYFRNSNTGLFIDGEKSDFLTLDGKSHKIIVNFCGKTNECMV